MTACASHMVGLPFSAAGKRDLTCGRAPNRGGRVLPGRVLKKKVTPVNAGTVKRSTPPAQNFAGSDPDLLRKLSWHIRRASL
jgi:hypothetical protein